MPRSAKTSVFRMDLDDHPEGKFCAFFYEDDGAGAQAWIDAQDGGTYEIRGK